MCCLGDGASSSTAAAQVRPSTLAADRAGRFRALREVLVVCPQERDSARSTQRARRRVRGHSAGPDLDATRRVRPGALVAELTALRRGRRRRHEGPLGAPRRARRRAAPASRRRRRGALCSPASTSRRRARSSADAVPEAVAALRARSSGPPPFPGSRAVVRQAGRRPPVRGRAPRRRRSRRSPRSSEDGVPRRLRATRRARRAASGVDVHGFLVEELLTGDEVTLEGYVHAGRTTIVGVTDSLKYAGTNSFERFEYPSALPPERLDGAGAPSPAASSRRTGFDDGFFNIELFVPETGAGETDRAQRRASPPSSRRSCERFTGRSTYDALLALACGDDPAWHAGLRTASRSATACACFEDAFVEGVPAPDDGVEILVAAGAATSRSRATNDAESYRLAIFHEGGETREEALERCRARAVVARPSTSCPRRRSPRRPAVMAEPNGGASTGGGTGGAAEIVFRASRSAIRAARPAVNDLSLVVPAGEICVLVGPSGGGKTTAMKMVNRLIDRRGRHHDRRDAASARSTSIELRRGIGYVIQQVGLFPHMTGRRQHRHRAEAARLAEEAHPRARRRSCSSSSASRRADAQALPGAALGRPAPARRPRARARREPAGDADGRAVRRARPDHARAARRTSSCACTARSRKTVIFVTHDIDEAIKIGDRIAILREGGVLAQYDTPDAILAAPADEFVERFVGADRGLKRLSLRRLGDVELEPAERASRPTRRAAACDDAARRALADAHGGRARGRGRRRRRARPSGCLSLRRVSDLLRGTADGVTGTSSRGGPVIPNFGTAQRLHREQRLDLLHGRGSASTGTTRSSRR